jgi:hypothetical protein
MTMSTEIIREGRRLKSIPLPSVYVKKSFLLRADEYQPKWVLLPGTKIKLAPHGKPSAKAVVNAAEVASQISAEVLISKSRIAEVVAWRTAAYLAIREVVPHISGACAARYFNRDHSSMVHARQKHEANPARLASKIAAIKGVLV